MDWQVYMLPLATECLCLTSHIVIHTVTSRCESVRKAVERVFGMLKKRFRILKLPLTGGDIQEIESMLFSCFIMHNMNLKDKARMDLGHMEGDWCDHAPGANRARRALYDIVNGRTLLFNKRAYTVADETDFSRLGCQISHHNFCNASNTVMSGSALWHNFFSHSLHFFSHNFCSQLLNCGGVGRGWVGGPISWSFEKAVFCRPL